MSSTDRNNTSVDIFSYNLVFIETGLKSKCLAQIGIIQLVCILLIQSVVHSKLS